MDLTRFIETGKELHLISLRVSQHGELVGKYNWDDDCRRNIYSASKSFTAAAVGIAQKEGLLSIDEPLTEAFPDDLPEEVNDHLKRATVRDLLTMCLGQEKASLMGAQRPYYKETDWVKLSLSIPFVYDPGSKFVYNNVGPYLAGILVQRRAGCDLLSYLQPRMLDCLGIPKTVWEVDRLGNTFGAGGLFLNVDELHKFGQLFLQDGAWDGKQLIPADWVRGCTTKQVDNGTPYGYGYLFWGGPDEVFRADGKYCQLSLIMRKKDAVVSILSECRDEEALMKAIYGEIYTQL